MWYHTQVDTTSGRLAQLVEHLLDVQEVTGSSPVPSTIQFVPEPDSLRKGFGYFFVYRRFCVRTTRNGKRAKAGYHYDSGILPFAILHRVWYTQLNNSEVGMEIYMRNYEIENEMYRRAVELIETRYPVGWGGAGVVQDRKSVV